MFDELENEMITQPPLTNLQMELLRLYSLKLSDNELLQVKEVLARYFAGRLGQHVDQLWQEQGLTVDDMERWLIDRCRAPAPYLAQRRRLRS